MTALSLIITLASAQAAALGTDVWDLSSLYPSPSAYDQDYRSLSAKLPATGSVRVAPTPQSLLNALDHIASMRRSAGRMYVYGLLTSMVDMTDSAAQSRYDQGVAMEAQVEAAVSHVEDQIRAIGEARVKGLSQSDPKLNVHERRLTQIFREGRYSIDREAMELLKTVAPWPRTSGDLYFSLINSPIGWRSAKDEAGQAVEIDANNYYRLRRSKDSKIREEVNRAYFGRLKDLEDPLGLMLTRRIAADITLAEKRKFQDGFGPLLLKEGLPDGAHRSMVETVRKQGAKISKFLDLRRKIIGLDRLSYDDLGMPLPVSSSKTFPLTETQRIILQSSETLGEDYQEPMRALLSTPWIHLRPQENKREDYGIWYSVGGSKPYGFMHYTDDYRSSTDYAGLAFLLMAYGNIPEDRPTDTRLDPGIYSNALVFAGNMLHADQLLKEAQTRDERLLYLMRAGSRLFQVARDALITDLQIQLQDSIRAGRTPSGTEISALYLKLLRETYPGVDIDDSYASEWLNSSLHFYSFEDLNFTLAMAAACELVSKAGAGDARAREAFWKSLGRGSSDYSYDLLKQAGVDLATPKPFEALFKRLDGIIGQIEKELAS